MSRFRFIENGICCDVYYDKNRSNGQCALFLYGFPATIGSNSLTDILVNKGYMVLHPHYYGTYDSSGDFSPDSAFLTVKNIVDIVHRSTVINLKTDKPINLPTNISVCIGYSFGAFVLRHTIQYLCGSNNHLKSILLVSPVMSNNPDNAYWWVNEDGEEQLNYVCKTRPFTYRIKDRNRWEIDYVNDTSGSFYKGEDNIENVLWLYGKDDSIMIEEKLLNRYLPATKNCFSLKATVDIVGVPEGEHGINSLITETTKAHILKIV